MEVPLLIWTNTLDILYETVGLGKAQPNHVLQEKNHPSLSTGEASLSQVQNPSRQWQSGESEAAEQKVHYCSCREKNGLEWICKEGHNNI